MMSLGIFDKFTITGYMLFALVGQAAFVLPIYASLGYTLFLGVCFYLALALPYLVENKPYLFEISWLIGAIFTWAAMTLMRKARDQHAEIAELNAKLAETHSLVQAQAEKLAQQAIEDSLTGLNNRRYLDADLPREFERARRLERKLTLAMLDIDHFKHINDRFSHHTGDQVLVTLANIFRQNCRTAVDSIVRYGGEEFIIYFPETDLHTAANIICERIRQATENYNWDWISHGLNVTLSIGLAEADKVSNHIDLIKTADSKLYEAKNGGRNRICSV
jgi:diguanylate cyclase (GGDEF)-like protein